MGKTVTTYLIDGEPQGSRRVFISNRICQMFIIPRANLDKMMSRSDLKKPSLYILVGKEEDSMPQAYIGQTENFCERVKQHNKYKDFWSKAYVFNSQNQALTKSDVEFLEHKAIATASKAKSYELDENKQIPDAPNLPDYQRDIMEEFFEDVKFLTAFSGCAIFDYNEPTKTETIFSLKGSGADAKGFYSDAGFTVLKGSIISQKSVPSLKWADKRAKMLKELAKMEKGVLVLQTNKTFPSPSGAACFCNGRSTNGWAEWKNDAGRSLDEVYRKGTK